MTEQQLRQGEKLQTQIKDQYGALEFFERHKKAQTDPTEALVEFFTNARNVGRMGAKTALAKHLFGVTLEYLRDEIEKSQQQFKAL